MRVQIKPQLEETKGEDRTARTLVYIPPLYSYHPYEAMANFGMNSIEKI